MFVGRSDYGMELSRSRRSRLRWRVEAPPDWSDPRRTRWRAHLERHAQRLVESHSARIPRALPRLASARPDRMRRVWFRRRWWRVQPEVRETQGRRSGRGQFALA